MFKNKNFVSTLGFVGAIVILLFALNWAFQSLAPKTIPDAGKTPIPSQPQENSPTPPPTPTMESYDFRGTKLYLAQSFPNSPANANVYLLKEDQPATVDEARALAQKFGIQSPVYRAPSQIPNTTDFVFTDGKQMLSVHSNFYWNYTADIVKNYNNFNTSSNPMNAEEIISEFLKSHGFDFAYQIEGDGLRGGYDVRPISPDGLPMQYEYFGGPAMNITLNENGQVLNVQASLMDYSQTPIGTFGIISAKEALQRMLDDDIQAGKMEGMSSASKPIQEWKRVYPINQTITIYGYKSLIPALDPNQPPFIQIDAYPIFGNIEGLAQLKGNGKLPDRPCIQATGQFVMDNGIEQFNVKSWKASDSAEYAWMGTLNRENGQVILSADPGNGEAGGNYLLPNVPEDIPMPFEHAFVVGTKIRNTIEWKLIDNRISANGGGGGGGGGGLGFYQLNLSGTPVPFPTATPVPTLSSGGNYVVQAGDTVNSIASANAITADELMKANGITDPSTLTIGQTLNVPNPIGNPNQPPVGKQYEAQRGILSVSIYNKPDGSQRSEYYLAINNHDGLYPYVKLEGDGLEPLQAYHNRPVEIWGRVVRYDQQLDMPVVNVERFNIPFPDLQFQIIKGTQKSIVIEGKTAILFTADNGTSYIQMQNNGDIDINIPSYLGDEVIFEVLCPNGNDTNRPLN